MEIKTVKAEKYGLIEMIGQFWESKDVESFDEAVTQFRVLGLSNVVADFTRISFISSQALGTIVRAYSNIKEAGGHFILLGPLGSVKETIQIAGFAQFMPICPSRDKLDSFIDGLTA
jgi:anti-anti-sigma factor